MTLKAFIFLFLYSLSCIADNQFSTAYINFKLPTNWNCYLEQTEYVCRSKDPAASKEALIIFTAKLKGPTDSIDKYKEHLSQPKTIINEKNQRVTSVVTLAPKLITINNTQWVDALQFGSEIPNYYTRYLGTVKDNIGIIVTFTAHKDAYTKYQSLFNNSVFSLSTRKPNSSEIQMPSPTSGVVGGLQNSGINETAFLDPFAAQEKPASSSHKLKYIGLAFIMAAIGFFLLVRARKK